MNDPTSSYGAPSVEAVIPKYEGTSRYAIGALLSALLCPIGPGAALGLFFSVCALVQIRGSRGAFSGKRLAMLALALSLLELGAVWQIHAWRQAQERDAPAVVERFFAGLAGNLAAEAVPEEMSAGLWLQLRGDTPPEALRLRALAAQPQAETYDSIRFALFNELGGFERVERCLSSKISRVEGELFEHQIKAACTLLFAAGVPAQVSLQLIREGGQWKVQAFTLRSPGLQRPIEVQGLKHRALQEHGRWSPTDVFKAEGGVPLRIFRKK